MTTALRNLFLQKKRKNWFLRHTDNTKLLNSVQTSIIGDITIITIIKGIFK
jgi:hypothetical protein